MIVPVEAVTLMVWWLYSARSWDPEWLHPFRPENVGTVLFQLTVAIVAVLLINRWLARKTAGAAQEVVS